MLRLLSIAAAVAFTTAQVPQGGSPRSFGESVQGQSIIEAPVSVGSHPRPPPQKGKFEV